MRMEASWHCKMSCLNEFVGAKKVSSNGVEFTKGLRRSWNVWNIWVGTPFTIYARNVIHTTLAQRLLAPTLSLVQITWKCQSLSRKKETP